MWDFNDLDLSERRFRALFADEETAAGRARVLSQLARIQGLRGDFAAGERLLSKAEALGEAEAFGGTEALGEAEAFGGTEALGGAAGLGEAESWVLIERGRLLRSSGDGVSALPLFEAAFERASAAGDTFLAADAAHMAALVGDVETWTARGIERTHDGPGRYWLAPLLNNVGWARYEAGDFDRALDAFTEALAVRSEDRQAPFEREIARFAVAKALRALGQIGEATAQLELAVAWATEAGVETPLIRQELAECFAAVGRTGEARVQAELALAHFGDEEAAAAPLRRLLEPPA